MDANVFSIYFSQLSSVTDERNQLKYVVDELNKNNNIEAGGDSVHGTLLQVVKLHLVYVFF